jgi:hypothetical protein
VIENGEARSIAITFPQADPENSFSIMKITWVDHQITNLSFVGGIGNTLPARPRHWNRRG